MNRLFSSVLATVAAASGVLATGAPADAATTCSDNAYSDGMGWYRFCKVDTAVTGASISGVISWNYNSPNSKNPNAQTGTANLAVTDTRKDGSCAWIRARYYGGAMPETNNYFDACGYGTTVKKGFEMNKQTVGQYSDGYFAFYVCSPKDTCTRIWNQAVADKGPS